jgi:hypothetical protein
MASTGEKRPASPCSDEDGLRPKKIPVVGFVAVNASYSSLENQEQASPSTPPLTNTDTTIKTGTSSKKKKKKPQPPIKTLFTPWDQELPKLPRFNASWGLKPMPGPDGPQPHSDQPPARTSNAQTVPPLWEDRKFRYKKGSRMVQTYRRGEEVPEDAPADLDQADNLILCLIDMRPKSRKDPTPRRMPFHYMYENGLPLDWNNKQTIKALNDRRQQAIDRITMDPPWTTFEREYLVSILDQYPNASILEIAERFNWRFMGQDFAKPTAFEWDYISTGRTTESIRHEYLTYKHKYDVGEVPNKKELADRSTAGKTAGIDRMHKFGKRDKTFDRYESDDSDAEDGASAPKKMQPKKTTYIQSDDVVDEYHSDPEDGFFVHAPLLTDQPQLSDGDEELLDLAGYNDSDVGSESSVTSAMSDKLAHAALQDEQFPVPEYRWRFSGSEANEVEPPMFM